MGHIREKTEGPKKAPEGQTKPYHSGQEGYLGNQPRKFCTATILPIGEEEGSNLLFTLLTQDLT